MKNNRSGKAAILKPTELDRIFRALKKPEHKLFFNIARYTGERFGAICQLQSCDVFVCYSGTCEPLREIIFRASTRKADPNGQRHTRQAIIPDRLHEYLATYRGACDRQWLFESPILPGNPITWSAADKWLRAAVVRAGLEHRGISGHSLRRTFITELARAGVADHVGMELTGHRSHAAYRTYIGADPVRLRDTINRVFA